MLKLRDRWLIGKARMTLGGLTLFVLLSIISPWDPITLAGQYLSPFPQPYPPPPSPQSLPLVPPALPSFSGNQLVTPPLSFKQPFSPAAPGVQLLPSTSGSFSSEFSDAVFSLDGPKFANESLFADATYDLPSKHRQGKYHPYFTNFRGYPGLFSTERGLLKEAPPWNFGLSYRYDQYKYLNKTKGVIYGRQVMTPINLLYVANGHFYGLSVPYQRWILGRSGTNLPTVTLSGVHDWELKYGLQIWEHPNSMSGATIHVSARFPGGNYAVPNSNFSGKTTDQVKAGPAQATKGGWVEAGGAYSRILTEHWNLNMNLNLALDSTDQLARTSFAGAMDYSIISNVILTGEISGSYWTAQTGRDGAIIDLLLGTTFLNGNWEANLGIPLSLVHNWGYGHDIGLQFSLNSRWD